MDLKFVVAWLFMSLFLEHLAIATSGKKSAILGTGFYPENLIKRWSEGSYGVSEPYFARTEGLALSQWDTLYLRSVDLYMGFLQRFVLIMIQIALVLPVFINWFEYGNVLMYQVDFDFWN
ncbi:hypothetical protein TCAL_15730 [Tigriopus californicus]|uniref:Anoctamin n=1 Tax=Tigriopus californicus TaxID=6832 RepID=A0A553P6N8_TIGCA|nr:uncharacterized protein LOC131878579 [Tigriopus californicus]TRY73345.1 hypothetical protein TCAL_15730 [Tigriopus californicus]